MSEMTQVQLGDTTVNVYPQRHAYLTNSFSKFVAKMAQVPENVTDAAGLTSFLGDRSYDLLTVLMPQYGRDVPFYEFMGYGSKEAYEARNYDEALDKSPSFAEIVTALKVAVEVNRFDVFGIVKELVDPKLLRAWVNDQVATAILDLPSPIEQSPSDGAETSTTSSETTPTSQDGNSDSPSPDSKASKKRSKKSDDAT